jgi:pyrroline-5-carboxylate reductase
MKKTIGIIGAGNMGEAFVGAVLTSKLFEKTAVWVSDVSSERLSIMETTYGIQTTHDSNSLFAQCDIVVLAVKPQQMNDVLSLIAAGTADAVERPKLIVSIAAGIRIEKIEAALYTGLPQESCARLPIIRVMPNTPALVLKGVSAMSTNRYVLPDDIKTAQNILSAMGTVVLLDETNLDAVTALSGSGPAYVFYLAESMINAGKQLGLTPENARSLTIGTIKGAMALMEERGESPEELRQKVTSPGGTTEAAIKVLDGKNVRGVFIEAITAAEIRSRELSE